MKKKSVLIKGVCVALCAVISACSDSNAPVFSSSPASARAPQSGKQDGYYKIGNPYQVSGVTYYPQEDFAYKEIGVASWYGSDFHNGITANGETYDMHSLTAAHRTLPLPSIVRVTNLQNGRSLVLRVNDRGPFVNNRIIDVSMRAAQLLDFKDQGTTQVQVEIMPEESRALRDELLARANGKSVSAAVPATTAAASTAVAAQTPTALYQLNAAPKASAAAPATLVGQTVAAENSSANYNSWDEDLPMAQSQKVVYREADAKAAAAKEKAAEKAALKKTSVAKKAAPATTATSRAVVVSRDVAPGYYVQVGAFASEDNARKMAQKVSSFGAPVITPVDVRGQTLYRVRVPAADAENAVSVLDGVTAAGVSGARLVEEKRAESAAPVAKTASYAPGQRLNDEF